MSSVPQDLLATILAKLTLKKIATLKLVCKQWKSILESKYFYELFQSHHQNLHSLWSLICSISRKEVMGHYGCTIYTISRFLHLFFQNLIVPHRRTGSALHEGGRLFRFGLILIGLENPEYFIDTYYVANLISREYVKIPPPLRSSYPTRYRASALITQVENNVVLSYKVVLMSVINIATSDKYISLLVYSSETDLWKFKTIQSPFCFSPHNPISLNGNLYWIGFNDTLEKYELVYHNFYATGRKSDRCRVIPFPGVEKKNMFRNVCTTSQGSLMYMSVEHKLSVWRLKREEWQLVSQVSLEFMNPGIDHVPMSVIDDYTIRTIQVTINPFNANTVYFWSKVQKRLASINLDKCKTGLHNNFECSSDGCNQSVYEGWDFWDFLFNPLVRMVLLPRWLYRIPCSPSRVKFLIQEKRVVV